MSWWGKVVGGAFGFLIGGPLGALLGGALGHKIDTTLQGIQVDGFSPGDRERTQAAFFTATFSVMGHIAKSDGQVTRDEISMAEKLMAGMHLDTLQRKAAIELFNSGKASEFDLAAVLDQFRKECHRRANLIRIFMEIQVQAALADGTIQARERALLSEIGRSMGIGGLELDAIISRMSGGAVAGSQTAGKGDPYQVLGVTRQTPLAEIRRSYRRLLSQHHPDKLVSKGLPEEMVKLANQKTSEIRTAWKQIKELRGIA